MENAEKNIDRLLQLCYNMKHGKPIVFCLCRHSRQNRSCSHEESETHTQRSSYRCAHGDIRRCVFDRLIGGDAARMCYTEGHQMEVVLLRRRKPVRHGLRHFFACQRGRLSYGYTHERDGGRGVGA